MSCDVATADPALSAPPAETRALFPLRLTAFEYYMYLDGRLGNPMAFTVELDIEGRLVREAFQQAIAYACARHPLCQATIISGRWGGKYWSLDRGCLPAVHWSDDDAAHEPWQSAPDVTCEAGVRTHVRDRGDQATITFQFHHACCDGVGASQWIQDVLARYAELTGCGAISGPPRVDAARLVDRRRRHLDRVSAWQWLTKGLYESYKFFLKVPRPLATPEDPAPGEPYGGILSHGFTREQTRRLRAQANNRGVTLNEWLVCDLFKAIARWDETTGQLRSRNPWYRISMPTSLREPADMTTPAANLVGMTFLNRRKKAIEAATEQLLDETRRESQEIRRLRRGTVFLDHLAMLRAIPGLLPVVLSLPLSLATAVLTNIGDPCRRTSVRFPRQDGKLVAGNIVIERVAAVPPLRRHTHAAIGVNTYAGQITISVRMTPSQFRRIDVQRFLDLYVEQIYCSLAGD